MVESQRTLTKPQLYEGLIDRLGRALDAARTAGRLRDERPLELELRGLSHLAQRPGDRPQARELAVCAVQMSPALSVSVIKMLSVRIVAKPRCI